MRFPLESPFSFFLPAAAAARARRAGGTDGGIQPPLVARLPAHAGLGARAMTCLDLPRLA